MGQRLRRRGEHFLPGLRRDSPHADGDAYDHAGRDADTHADPGAYGDADNYAYSHADAHNHCDADSHTDRYPGSWSSSSTSASNSR